MMKKKKSSTFEGKKKKKTEGLMAELHIVPYSWVTICIVSRNGRAITEEKGR